jgi:hypothetical protein
VKPPPNRPVGCDRGFVCEDHPNQRPQHDGCRGAGAQCASPLCRWWQGELPLVLNPAVQFDQVIATSGASAKRRMLKAQRPAAAKTRKVR